MTAKKIETNFTTIITPGVRKIMTRDEVDEHVLDRFYAGDWGDGLPQEDVASNDRQLKKGGSLYGWYDTPKGPVQVVAYIFDEQLTVLTPEEY